MAPVPVSLRGCLDTPPPKPPTLHREKCGDKHCYSEADARALGLWARAMERWADDAWEFCRTPEPKKELPDG